jgi:hypothetical protein
MREIASLPTKYRISGLLELTAFRISSTTSDGEEEEELFSSLQP